MLFNLMQGRQPICENCNLSFHKFPNSCICWRDDRVQECVEHLLRHTHIYRRAWSYVSRSTLFLNWVQTKLGFVMVLVTSKLLLNTDSRFLKFINSEIQKVYWTRMNCNQTMHISEFPNLWISETNVQDHGFAMSCLNIDAKINKFMFYSTNSFV